MGCTGLSGAIFCFSKVFLFLQRHIYGVKNIHQLVFSLSHGENVMQKTSFVFFNFLRPKERNENHELKDAARC